MILLHMTYGSDNPNALCIHILSNKMWTSWYWMKIVSTQRNCERKTLLQLHTSFVVEFEHKYSICIYKYTIYQKYTYMYYVYLIYLLCGWNGMHLSKVRLPPMFLKCFKDLERLQNWNPFKVEATLGKLILLTRRSGKSSTKKIDHGCLPLSKSFPIK